MVARNDIQLMVQVARLYFENGLTQEEIARLLNITRQKVSRLLIAARSKGIVQINIYDPTPKEPDLANELKSKFHLQDVILAAAENLGVDQLRASIGLAAAEYLKQHLLPNHNVGIGWGRTLFETVNLLGVDNDKKINVTPLIGGIGDISPFFQVNELARRLADAFSGTYRHLYVPAFIEDTSILEKLLNSQEVTQINELWNRLDVAIVGIGQLEFQQISSMFFADHIAPQTLALLESKGAVGDLCARFFDIQGSLVISEMGVIGVGLEKLKTTPDVIAIAGGLGKTRAVLGALRSGCVKTLVTDTATARAVLLENDERR
jgi:deoxyribonucleoside regulator